MRPLERFLERAPWARSLDAADVERVLGRLLERAQRENPDVCLDLGDFAASLATRVKPEESEPLERLQQLYVGDLFLALALSQGDRAAMAQLSREHLPRLSGFVKRALLPAPGELEQAVLTRLFLRNAGEPRILQYSGRGPLGAWLRMLALRAALDLKRARSRVEEPVPSLEDPGVATDPELDYLKLRYAGAFKTALEQVLTSLSDRDVSILRLTFVDNLSATVIGTMYGVSARTVQRWSAEIRATVLERTRKLLAERLSLSRAELDSLLGLVQSQLHLSLHRVLEARQAPRASDSSPPGQAP